MGTGENLLYKRDLEEMIIEVEVENCGTSAIIPIRSRKTSNCKVSRKASRNMASLPR